MSDSLQPRDPMDCSTPGFPVLHYLPEFAQVHVHSVDDAIINRVLGKCQTLTTHLHEASLSLLELRKHKGGGWRFVFTPTFWKSERKGGPEKDYALFEVRCWWHRGIPKPGRVLPCSITLPTMKTSSLKIFQSLEQSYSHSKLIITIIKIKKQHYISLIK